MPAIIDHRQEHGIDVLTPRHDCLDAATAPEFRQRLREFIDGGAVTIVMNLEQVSFMDSSGLGTLITGLKGVEGKGRFVVCGVNDQIAQLLEITHVNRVLEVFPDEAAAVEALRRGNGG